MLKADVQLAHEAARRNHEVNERVKGMRDAAALLCANLPTGHIACATFQQIASQLRKDALTLETSIR